MFIIPYYDKRTVLSGNFNERVNLCRSLFDSMSVFSESFDDNSGYFGYYHIKLSLPVTSLINAVTS